jgi:glycosyltransferase involved in cell wall biosynthesis
MHNILIITSHFPPQQIAGANRPFSLYKYLPTVNVKPVILTKRFSYVLGNTTDIHYSDSFINWRDSGLLSSKRLLRYVYLLNDKVFGIYPDKLWINRAIKDGKKIIKDNKIELIYATFPGTEALKIGMELSAQSGIPLVTEFRDGLVYESILRNTNFLQKFVARSLERNVIRQSSAIITIADAITTYFSKSYPSSKVYTVRNGFDEDDFSEIISVQEPNSSSPKMIYHFGNLNSSRSTDRSNLFEAISILKRNNEISRDTLRFIFIGTFTKAEYALVADYDLLDLVVFKKHMPKREGIVEMMEKASGLLFYGVQNESSIISSKLPEYLRMNKPILGICKGNEAENIIQDTSTGLVCDFDVNSIANMFREFLANKDVFNPDISKINLFNRKSQAQQIGKIISKVILSNGSNTDCIGSV